MKQKIWNRALRYFASPRRIKQQRGTLLLSGLILIPYIILSIVYKSASITFLATMGILFIGSFLMIVFGKAAQKHLKEIENEPDSFIEKQRDSSC